MVLGEAELVLNTALHGPCLITLTEPILQMVSSV
jgi:hypothetical protein